nr:gamma-glutamyl-gamma-aminobutyrate hydrolase family protein [Virgibacillus litoralis]
MTLSMEIDKSHYTATNDNVEAIIQAGGMPVMLPYLSDECDVEQVANKIDGLYATGGYDIDPTLFGEEPHPQLGTIIPARDQFEISVMKKLLKMGKPILGVCRGCQTLNIAAGGDMYQDIYSQINGDLLQHTQKAPMDHGSHFVYVSKNSLLSRLTGMDHFRINSWHHQANRKIPSTFQVSGTASDGIIEAIESKQHSFVLGLQWHPEAKVKSGDVTSLRIYQSFIEACKVER